jgi:uncharacterized protein YcaQ
MAHTHFSSDGLSIKDARRIALAAQGFDRPRPSGKVQPSHLRRVIRQLGLLQIDYVNVLLPAQYQVPFSRLGAYDRASLDRLVYGRREFTEQWAHEASIVPMETWPLLHHRRETHRVRPWGFEKFMEKDPAYAALVLEEVRRRGPLTAGDLPCPEGVVRRIPGAWVSVPRAVMEAHFGRGLLAVAGRLPNFGRQFDLAERLVPPEHHGRPVPREEAQRELLRQAARAHGIATAGDLADYFRLPISQARPRIAELVELGEVREVAVEGWRQKAYLHRQAALPRPIDAAALLSPFDPVVWYRDRARRLFDFDYRIEIWVPKPMRRWGYYVLPFLLGDRLVARVDLKADRAARRLQVLAAYLEPHASFTTGGAGEVADALARELTLLARWLGLDSVAVARQGNFAQAVRKALA